MSLTGIAVALMLLGFLCVLVGFLMEDGETSVVDITDRSGTRRYVSRRKRTRATPRRKAA
jgi:hypothetical protein